MDALALQTWIVTAVPFIIHLYSDDYNRTDEKETLAELAPDLSLPRIHKYEYIIVGAGSAGCLLAERLSKDHTVLLLETGGYPPPATYNSFLFHQVEGNTFINYQYSTVPQQNFAKLTNGVFTFRTGKMLGGSGQHNNNKYNRGSAYDYDGYATFIGDTSFKYSNMMKYFKRFENFRGWLINETEWNDFGHSGNFVIEKAFNPFMPVWFTAGTELGFQIADPNPYQRVSFTPMDKSEYDVVRSSSYSSFVKPIDGKRSNLRVLKYSTVEQILIKDGTAYGVTYKRHGIPQIAHASREVIVSAGFIGSPMLLIKSGIGPSDTLQAAGIPVNSVIPAVGQNLNDHAALQLIFKLNNIGEYAKYYPTTKEQIQEALVEYQLPQPNKHGYFTVTDGPQVFFASSRAKADGEANWPDVQLVLANEMIDENSPEVSVYVVLGRAKSTGQIGFNSTAYLQGERDDTKLAIIDPKYFSDDSDFTVFLEGIRFAIQIMTKTKAFSSLNPTLAVETPAPCQGFQQGSDDYWKCFIQCNAGTWWHYTATNRLGADTDTSSVLFSNFTVKGIKRLRVVDASALPRTTDANINAATLSMAEKSVDAILHNPSPLPINSMVNNFGQS